MTPEYWQKQTKNEPLFPDLIWSRPERKETAGKILIIGGNSHGFSAPAQAYQTAYKSGGGNVRALLPDAIKKLIKGVLPEAEFAPSTPSGSFASMSLDSFLQHTAWADVIILAGDLGRNSETAIVIEKFLQKSSKPIIATKDAVDYIVNISSEAVKREDLTLVLSIAQLQKMARNLSFPQAVTFDMGTVQLVEFLHIFTSKFKTNIVTSHSGNIFVASGGRVSTTKSENDDDFWRVNTATIASVWLAQNPGRNFEAITTSTLH